MKQASHSQPTGLHQRMQKTGWKMVAFSLLVAANQVYASPGAHIHSPELRHQERIEGPADRDGDGTVEVTGELKKWHKVTLTLAGPHAHEQDEVPNPFTDYRMDVRFTHESGSPSYLVPGYFAADGDAANTSAESGNQWRAHLAPDKEGVWKWEVYFVVGEDVALDRNETGKALERYEGKTGTLHITSSDKTGRDFRGHGRLEYVGGHHLRFAGSGEYFLKAGPDAPETFLAYEDFDGTETRKDNVPLKSWAPHVKDWKEGDPTWKDGQGKGMIGALNYLASKGLNAFSFLPYNAGGDGDNVWPFVERDAKLTYDCSKLDQWGIVFDHATAKGLYLHFKLQEQEIDEEPPTALDQGELGPERKLYCRELVARFGHALALNWNIGEENAQSPEQQRAMIRYLREVDPYDHHVVLHTFPNQQDKIYNQLLGQQSLLTGASLQNEWNDTHRRTIQWVQASANTITPWVVANDEQGPASHGVPPDPGYDGFDGVVRHNNHEYDLHDIRKATLWGNLMAGGAGIEYYFGYQLPQNDLVAEDFRSRDKTWDFCRIALEFFRDHRLPFWRMHSSDALVGNPDNANTRYCLALPNWTYVVYLAEGGSTELNLSDATGTFEVRWYDPRKGGTLQSGSVMQVQGGATVPLGNAPSAPEQDWVVLIRR